LLVAVLALAPAALLASEGTTGLGATAEVYRVKTGTYKALFANAPAEEANNTVLALDVTRGGTLQRLLVPGTDGPEVEQDPALTIDRSNNRVYLVWEGRRNIHSLLNLVGYTTADGFGDIFEISGDAFSTKSNPQLATTLDEYQVLGSDDQPVTARRTILHLVWYDDGGFGQRELYTPLVIENDELLLNRIFDLTELATGQPASGTAVSSAPAALLQSPQIRSGRDGQSVVIGFVDPSSGDLESFELRSVTGELVSFAEKARIQIIETGRANPGATRSQIAEKARIQIIETGRRLLRADVAEYLAQAFIANLSGSDPNDTLDDSADKARIQIIETGVSLRRGIADKSTRVHVVEIGRSSDDLGSSHLIDLRLASHRALPSVPDAGVRLFLSAKGDEAALAWSTAGSVLYRESDGDAWGPQRSLALGPSLALADAFALVDQRTGPR
jgi:hypothetical protein